MTAPRIFPGTATDRVDGSPRDGWRRAGVGALRIAVVLLVAVAAVGPARGNCAQPVSYEASVEGNRVTVCPQNFADRTCPDPGGLLRQDEATGATVRIGDLCGDDPSSVPGGFEADAGTGGDTAQAAAGAGPCYQDECVSAGTYRYGFGVPYECVSSACSTDFYVRVTVEAPLSRGCRRSPGAVEPRTHAAGAPWGESAWVCGYGGGGGGATTSGGCSATSRAAAGVFALQLLAALGGLFLWRTRRRRAVGGR